VTALRVVSPVMPFLADHLWRVLRAEDAPASVFLAGWPEAAAEAGDDELLAEVGEVRRVVELGRQARGDAGIKLRQPLKTLAFVGADRAAPHEDEIKDELRIKRVIRSLPVHTVSLKPDLRLLGPKLGRDLPRVRDALEQGRYDLRPDGTIIVEGFELNQDEVLGHERVAGDPNSHWVFAEDGSGIVVALETTLDPELELEGRVLDLIHALNGMRKDAGLELTDRIRVRLPQSQAELLRHEEWIKDEVLAVELETDGISEPQIEKV
jgi:isoleucyl-tRNA synthetase